MKNTLLALALIGFASAPSLSANEPRGSSKTEIRGASTEVRNVSNNLRRGPKVTKLIITRDAGGRIISVKRG